MKWQAKPYQLRGVQHVLDAANGDGACMLLADPGLGKTSMSLAAFITLRARGKVRKLLVLAPRRALLATWPDEIAKWDQFSGLRVAVVNGTPEQRLHALCQDADVYLARYDHLQWLGHLDPIYLAAFDMLVLDESTKVKNHGTQRMDGLTQLLGRFAVRLALTGTPVPLHVGDLFGQVYACDSGRRLGASITQFRMRYMRAKWLPTIPAPMWEPQHDALERVLADLDGMALRIGTEGNLVMPELIRNTIKVTLPATAMNTYKRFKRDLLVQIEGNEVVAANAATAAMKLRQIASGTVYVGDTIETIHDAKAEALIDLLQEQQGSPLLIAVAFRSEAAYLVRKLKAAGFGTVPTLMGGMTDAAADKVIRDWNAGKLPAVICHPETVAHGLNLQSGGHSVCWYTMTYNLEHYTQFNARVYRQGQKSSVVIIHHIAALETVDEHVACVIESKDARQDELFEALINHAKDTHATGSTRHAAA